MTFVIFLMLCGQAQSAIGAYQGESFTIHYGQDARVLLKVLHSEEKEVYRVDLEQWTGVTCSLLSFPLLKSRKRAALKTRQITMLPVGGASATNGKSHYPGM